MFILSGQADPPQLLGPEWLSNCVALSQHQSHHYQRKTLRLPICSRRLPVSSKPDEPPVSMHNQITASTGMDQESYLAQENNTYGSNGWVVDMNNFHHQTTMPDYGGGGYHIMTPITQGLPSESLGRMPPPPSHPIHQPQATHGQLPILPVMMQQHQWPSMLASPHNYGGPPHSAPPVPIPPITAPLVTAPLKASKLPAIQTTSQPRKTLTDDVRREMCQYAEDNPTAKQTDIGARFGVERR